MKNTKPLVWLLAAGEIAVQVVLVAVIVHGESLTIRRITYRIWKGSSKSWIPEGIDP